MKRKLIPIAPVLFFFVPLFGIVPSSAKADDSGKEPPASQYQWVLWQVVQTPQGLTGLSTDTFLTKKSCKDKIPRKTSIYGEGPKKKGYECLPRGVPPVYLPHPQDEQNIHSSSGRSPASGN